MKVLLCEDVAKCGNAGDVKDVSDGFARNFLLPKKLAQPATDANLKRWESEKKVREVRVQQSLEAAQKLASELGNVVIGIEARAGREGHLFGSITSAMVAEALLAKGYSVDKKSVEMKEHIKTVGEHAASVRLHPQVTANLKVNVTAAAEETAPKS